MDAIASRRHFLLAGLGALAVPLVRPAGAAAASRERFVIVNADDLGLSAEIDRGILEAHDRGIVTSASLLVDAPDAEAAVREARQRPGWGWACTWPSTRAASGSWTCRTSTWSSASSSGRSTCSCG